MGPVRASIIIREEDLAPPDSVRGDSADTFPSLLLRHARTQGNRTAIREKDLGIWQSWTWADVNAGLTESISDATPATCGVAMLVPW